MFNYHLYNRFLNITHKSVRENYNCHQSCLTKLYNPLSKKLYHNSFYIALKLYVLLQISTQQNLTKLYSSHTLRGTKHGY